MAGGESWDNPANWIDQETLQPAQEKPQNIDTVKFTAASQTNCSVNVEARVADLQIVEYTKRIFLDKTLTVDGGKLNTLTQNGDVWTIGGSGDLVIATGATFTWSSGTMAGADAGQTAGKTIVRPGATLKIVSSVQAEQDARLAGRELVIETLRVQDTNLYSNGTVNFTNGQIFCQDDPRDNTKHAQITNYGVFNISGTASKIYQGNPSTFTNAGLGLVTVNLDNANMTFTMWANFINNSKLWPAAVNVGQGQLALTGGGASKGTWYVQEGQKILLTKEPVGAVPQFTWDMGTAFGGGGILELKNAVVTLADAAKVEVLPTLYLTGATVQSAAGMLKPELLVQRKMLWTDGKIQGTGTLTLAPRGVARIVGNTATQSAPVLSGWEFANNGTVMIGLLPTDDASYTRVDFTMTGPAGNGAKLTNQGGATITLYDNSNIKGVTGQARGIINVNKGVLEKVANSGVSDFQVTINDPIGTLVKLPGGNEGFRILDDNGGVTSQGGTQGQRVLICLFSKENGSWPFSFEAFFARRNSATP